MQFKVYKLNNPYHNIFKILKSGMNIKGSQGASLDHDRTLLQRQIEATDAAIDKLVYELYGLTEEEIAVVEGGGK